MTRTRMLPLALGLTLLSACSTPGTATPAASASHKPATAAAATAQLPSHVHLPMPEALSRALGGAKASSLLTGASIVAQGGGNIVAQGGGNIVAQGGGNYGLLACAAPSVTGQSYFLDIMNLVLAPYADTVLIINSVLEAALAAKLQPGVPGVVDDPRDATGKAKLALLLTTDGGKGLLQAAEGTTFTPATQIIGLSFEGTTKGHAVYSSTTLDPQLGHLAIATTFDLDEGTVSADGIADPTVLPNAQNSLIYRAHWEFAVPRQASDADPIFTMRLAGNNHDVADACNTAEVAVSANFSKDGQAAVRMGRVLPGATALSYTRNDGTGYDATASSADDFFLDISAGALDPSKASRTLVGMAPAASTFPTSYPPDPGVGTPFGDAVFAFPATP